MQNPEQIQNNSFYSIDAVMFDSKKKKNPNTQTDPKNLEEDVKGKKVTIVLLHSALLQPHFLRESLPDNTWEPDHQVFRIQKTEALYF